MTPIGADSSTKWKDLPRCWLTTTNGSKVSARHSRKWPPVSAAHFIRLHAGVGIWGNRTVSNDKKIASTGERSIACTTPVFDLPLHELPSEPRTSAPQETSFHM